MVVVPSIDLAEMFGLMSARYEMIGLANALADEKTKDRINIDGLISLFDPFLVFRIRHFLLGTGEDFQIFWSL